MEDLSDSSFLGKLLVFPSNVRLDWKVIASYKPSSLFVHSVSDSVTKKKVFIKMTPGEKVKKIFFFFVTELKTNKLVCLSLENRYSLA